MALFERKPAESVTGDAATRALSVTAVENDFVEAVYDKLSIVYDLTFGPTLHPGRLQAIERMNIQPGERVLEVGVGTGINLALYPREATVTGIDFTAAMLEKARERAARKDASPVRLLQMDAADLKFADNSFDIVYAPYLISVVPDPVKVAQEMHRVCRPGGRVIILNHFLSPNRFLVARDLRQGLEGFFQRFRLRREQLRAVLGDVQIVLEAHPEQHGVSKSSWAGSSA